VSGGGRALCHQTVYYNWSVHMFCRTYIVFLGFLFFGKAIHVTLNASVLLMDHFNLSRSEVNFKFFIMNSPISVGSVTSVGTCSRVFYV